MKKFNQLSRTEMKNLIGGLRNPDDGGGESGQNCCAHNADWSQAQCGYPNQGQAHNAATSAAIQDPSQHWYYCCTC